MGDAVETPSPVSASRAMDQWVCWNGVEQDFTCSTIGLVARLWLFCCLVEW